MPRGPQSLRAYKGAEEEDQDVSLSASELEGADETVESDRSDSASEDENDNDAAHVQEDLRDVSFGALAEAQNQLAKESGTSHRSTAHNRRGRRSDSRTDAEKVNLLRERLADLKKIKSNRADSSPFVPPKSLPNTSKPHARESKHAPAEQSSRRAVPRYRPIVDVGQNPYHSRDPRFSYTATGQQPQHEEWARHNYAFLDEYRKSELSSLKETLGKIIEKKKKRKSKAFTEDEEAEVETLKRNINSMENRMKSEASKDRQRQIARVHKKEEREKITQGKKPYFLKNSEIKDRAEKERFEGMRAKEKEKVLSRRKKKQEQREMRAMPNQRRQTFS